MNPLLFLMILIVAIALSLVACVRAIVETGAQRLLWIGVVAVIALVTLGSLAVA